MSEPCKHSFYYTPYCSDCGEYAQDIVQELQAENERLKALHLERTQLTTRVITERDELKRARLEQSVFEASYRKMLSVVEAERDELKRLLAISISSKGFTEDEEAPRGKIATGGE